MTKIMDIPVDDDAPEMFMEAIHIIMTHAALLHTTIIDTMMMVSMEVVMMGMRIMENDNSGDLGQDWEWAVVMGVGH